MVQFWVSALVFMMLAVAEALIHYSDGYHHDQEGIILVWPSIGDWWRLLTIMVVFAIIHGYLQKILE